MLRSRIILCISRRFSSTHFQEIENAECITVKNYGSTAVISINRSAKRNALNRSLVHQLKQAINEFENNKDVTAAVLCGEGGNFCAGYDLEELAENQDFPEHFVNNDLTEHFVRKPLVAAINGYAVGFGFDLALWCDLRVMDETAVLGCLGRRYGSSMSEIGVGRLHAMVGLSKAMDIILSSKSIRSEEALNCGLANRIVACGTAIGQALNIANDLAKFPQSALLKDRATLYKHAFAEMPLRNSLDDEAGRRYKEQSLKDIKRGAKLFTTGAGKHGQLFSQFLWDKV